MPHQTSGKEGIISALVGGLPPTTPTSCLVSEESGQSRILSRAGWRLTSHLYHLACQVTCWTQAGAGWTSGTGQLMSEAPGTAVLLLTVLPCV